MRVVRCISVVKQTALYKQWEHGPYAVLLARSQKHLVCSQYKYLSENCTFGN
jgi:hypothetical protein